MTITSGKLIMSKNTSKMDEHGHMHALSYAAQSPWLRHQSIKDNIMFGYWCTVSGLSSLGFVRPCWAFRSQRHEFVSWTEGSARLYVVCMICSASWWLLKCRSCARHLRSYKVCFVGRFLRRRRTSINWLLALLTLWSYFLSQDSHTARFLYERLLRGVGTWKFLLRTDFLLYHRSHEFLIITKSKQSKPEVCHASYIWNSSLSLFNSNLLQAGTAKGMGHSGSGSGI
jgi:hypothetical protein